MCALVTHNKQFKTHAHLFADTAEDSTNLKLSTAIIGLTCITLLVAILSEFLVDSIDGFTEEVRTRTFAFAWYFSQPSGHTVTITGGFFVSVCVCVCALCSALKGICLLRRDACLR